MTRPFVKMQRAFSFMVRAAPKGHRPALLNRPIHAPAAALLRSAVESLLPQRPGGVTQELYELQIACLGKDACLASHSFAKGILRDIGLKTKGRPRAASRPPSPKRPVRTLTGSRTRSRRTTAIQHKPRPSLSAYTGALDPGPSANRSLGVEPSR